MPLPIPIPPPNYITWDEVTLIGKFLAPSATIIIGLLIVTYKTMQTTSEKLAAALEAHVLSDDKEHDRLFTDLRATDSKLDHLLGEHDCRKGDCSERLTNHPNPDNTRLPP